MTLILFDDETNLELVHLNDQPDDDWIPFALAHRDRQTAECHGVNYRIHRLHWSRAERTLRCWVRVESYVPVDYC